jgi:hypothetical protein
LRDTLAEIRRGRGGKPGKPKAAPKPDYSSLHTEHGEHPQVYALTQWLPLLATALCHIGVAADFRVGCGKWEQDGCVELKLQRWIKQTVSVPIVAGAGMVTTGQRQVPLRPGAWEVFKIPVGALNNHDIKWVLRSILGSSKADIVLADATLVRAIHGR